MRMMVDTMVDDTMVDDTMVDEQSGYVSVLQLTQMGENIATKLFHFSINCN